MIVAQVPLKGTWIDVRVLDVFKSSRGTVAYVHALPMNGQQNEPFIRWTHGGWAYFSMATYPVTLLRNIAVKIEIPTRAQVNAPTT